MAILVVDDNEPGRHVKSRQLSALGYQVHEAASAASAVAAMRSNAIELAIIDVRLPDMSGLELCKVIKRQNANLLVLQTSAEFTAAVDRAAGLEQGADAYLVEPMEPTEFVATVRALLRLREAELHRELLVRELSHRVKNSLAIVQSLIGFTRRSATSLDDFETVLISRVHAIARAHDILMQTAWEGASLSSHHRGCHCPLWQWPLSAVGPGCLAGPEPSCTLRPRAARTSHQCQQARRPDGGGRSD